MEINIGSAYTIIFFLLQIDCSSLWIQKLQQVPLYNFSTAFLVYNSFKYF
jgi:hypothetical protein